jgi:5'-nucleotidase (lipoprotein e(P4) family)
MKALPMSVRLRLGLLPGLALGFLAGAGAQALLRPTVAQPPEVLPTAPAPFKQETPPFRGLDANLYMQTAAEYRACCLQAYNVAEARLRALRAELAGKRPRAVIMDLDETVLDNAGFQAMQLRSGLAYDQRLWDLWEEKHADKVGLIPGAKDFIIAARKLGFTVVYITNRNDQFRKGTEKALDRLGIAPEKPEHLLLATTTSDKTERRAQVRKNFDVVMLVGDNLRDFDELFAFPKAAEGKPEPDPDALIRDRKGEVDKERSRWGCEFIILPNPAYGEWTKPLGRGEKDLDRLVPTTKGK